MYFDISLLFCCSSLLLSLTHTLEAPKKNFGSVECGARGGEKVNCQSSWNEIQASIVCIAVRKKTQVAYPMENKQFLLTPYLFFIFSPSILRRQYRARDSRGRSLSQHLHYHCAIVHCHTIESLVSLNVRHTYTTMYGNFCCHCKYVIHESTCEKLMRWKNNTDKTQYKNINFSHFR